MKQTVENPRLEADIEKRRQYETVEKWYSLSDTDKILHKTEFIAELEFEYHKPFFERMDFEQLIRERWFHQYIEKLYFSPDEFDRK